MLKWVPASLKPADIGMWCNDRLFEGIGGVKPGDKSWNTETMAESPTLESCDRGFVAIQTSMLRYQVFLQVFLGLQA